jgi:hypothetical protein
MTLVSKNPWHAPTRVGALVFCQLEHAERLALATRQPCERLWGIVTEDGKDYRTNQVRVKWLAGPRFGQRWTYIMDLTFVTLPGDAKEPRA